jgi:pimeloyl-ACP methyl ester carboxylesterase
LTAHLEFVEIVCHGVPLRIEHRLIDASRAEAPRIVFLHEGLGCVAMWRDFPDRLCAALDARGLVYSRPGYGASTPHPPDPDAVIDRMRREAYDVLPALLDSLHVDGARPLWLFGHSDGGSIALLFAGRHRERLTGAVVLAPHIMIEPITLASLEKARAAYEEGDLRARLARYHADPDAAFYGWNAFWRHPHQRSWSIEHDLFDIRCPLLAIQGVHDEYGTLEQVRGIARRVPGTTLLELDDCGHAPHRERAEALIDAVRERIA